MPSIVIKPFMVLGLFAICWIFLGEFAHGFDRYIGPGGFRGPRKPGCIKWGNKTLWEVYLEAFPRLNYPFPIQTFKLSKDNNNLFCSVADRMVVASFMSNIRMSFSQ